MQAISRRGPVHMELTDSQLTTYRDTGWIAVPGFYSAAEAEEIRRYTEELSALPEVSGAQMVYREQSLIDTGAKVLQRVEDFCGHHAGFDRLMRGRLQDAVAALIGEPALLFKDKINYKMPGGAGFEPHQDQQAGWTRYAPIFVTALVSIDATTLENGCLEMPMGARKLGLIGSEWTPLSGAELESINWIPVTTAPGDVLFFDSYVPHTSKPNFTTQQRRVLYVTYNGQSHGDQRGHYYADKRAAFPPDIDRKPGDNYRYRV